MVKENAMNTYPHHNQSIDISYQHIIRLAIPVLFANLAMPLQSAIDTAVVGHFHQPSQLAGMGIAIQLLSLLLVSFNFLQYSSSGLSAQVIGKYKPDSALKANTQLANSKITKQQAELLLILQRSMLLAILIGIILFISQSWLIELGLHLLLAQKDNHIAASTYLQTRFWSVTAELINFVFLGWLAGQGKTRLMLYQQSFIAITNIILTLTFVYVFHLGLMGVALGTTLAFWLGVLFALVMSHYLLHIPFKQFFYFDKANFVLDKMLRLFSLNKDIFIRTTILTVSFAWITRLSAQHGDVVLATNAILLQVLTISAFALDSLAVSTETLSGQTFGQKIWQDFKTVIKRTGIVSYVLATGLSVIWWLALPNYLSIMTDIDSIIQMAHEYRYFVIALPLVGVGAYWLDGVFFGLTAGKIIRNAALLVGMIFFPVSWLLNHYFGVTGIWLSVWLLLLLRFIILACFLKKSDITS